MTNDMALVVGGKTGIGAEAVRQLHWFWPDERKIFAPSREELDAIDYIKVAEYIRKRGPFSHIVYSAGINQLAWVDDTDFCGIVEGTFLVNVVGFVRLISQHIRIWPDQPVSAVAVSSDAGRIPMRGSVAYCTSKAALNMAVRTMARELAPTHRINAVAPGMVEGTPMTEYIDSTIPDFRGWTPEEARAYEKQGTPTGRRATVEEVARTIVWVLTGPEQMTGAIIDINGGR